MCGDQEEVEAQADEQAAERDLEVAHGVLAPEILIHSAAFRAKAQM